MEASLPILFLFSIFRVFQMHLESTGQPILLYQDDYVCSVLCYTIHCIHSHPGMAWLAWPSWSPYIVTSPSSGRSQFDANDDDQPEHCCGFAPVWDHFFTHVKPSSSCLVPIHQCIFNGKNLIFCIVAPWTCRWPHVEEEQRTMHAKQNESDAESNFWEHG